MMLVLTEREKARPNGKHQKNLSLHKFCRIRFPSVHRLVVRWQIKICVRIGVDRIIA